MRVGLLNAPGDFRSLAARLAGILGDAGKLLFHMGYLADKGFRRLILLHRSLMQLAGLTVELLGHMGKLGGGIVESGNCLVHGLDDGAQAVSDQCEIAFIVCLRTDIQIAVSNLCQYLLDIGYVVVDTLYCRAQSQCQYLKLVAGTHRLYRGVQVAIGERYHAGCHAFDRS